MKTIFGRSSADADADAAADAADADADADADAVGTELMFIFCGREWWLTNNRPV